MQPPLGAHAVPTGSARGTRLRVAPAPLDHLCIHYERTPYPLGARASRPPRSPVRIVPLAANGYPLAGVVGHGPWHTTPDHLWSRPCPGPFRARPSQLRGPPPCITPHAARSGPPATRPYGDVVQQYLDLRDQNPGVILLYRIGSFYEVLFEDADLVADVLGLKLSDRPSGGSAPPVPQCGFTHHALDSFLARLLSRGYRVAVCEEEEDTGPDSPIANGQMIPAARGTRQRSIVRTLTPGTVTDPRLLREDRPSYLVAVAANDGARPGLAWTDVSVGEFHAGEFVLEEAIAEIQRLDPAEDPGAQRCAISGSAPGAPACHPRWPSHRRRGKTA